MSDKRILVVPREDLTLKQGFFLGEENLLDVLDSWGLELRGEALEKDASMKQIIPYILLNRGHKFFVYQRMLGEARLEGRYSIGIGGHIKEEDGSLKAGILREIAEEVQLKNPASEPLPHHILGFVNDDSTEVGSAHLGIVQMIVLPDDAEVEPAVPPDPCLAFLGFQDLDWMLENLEKFEDWSKILIENMPQVMDAISASIDFNTWN